MTRLIEIPDDGIITIPIMNGKDTVGYRNIDLSDFPVVDAVKAVRCGECKHRDNCNLMTDDDFCSDKERKEDID